MASRLYSRALVNAFALMQAARTAGRRRKVDVPRRILLAHHLLLGDTIMLTPLIAKLRERFPQAYIAMTTPRAWAPLYRTRPYGVDAMVYDPRDVSTLSAWRRHRGFDWALVPGDNRYSWLALGLDARWIVAFAGDRPRYKSWPVDELRAYPDRPAAWGDMVAGLIPGPPPRPYRASDWPAPACEEFALPPDPYCVLHIGASSALKLWQSHKWRALARLLEERGNSVVWSAGPKEEKYLQEVDPEGRYPAYAGSLNLAQLWHLIAKARLLVSPDTGVAHLGRLTATPTVALFGPGSAVICGRGDFWRESPYRGVAIEEFPCRDQKVLFKREIEWVRRCGRGLRECGAPACMHAIDVERVWQAVGTLPAVGA